MEYLIPFLKGFGFVVLGILIITAFFWGFELIMGNKPENEYDWADHVCVWFAGGTILLSLLGTLVYGCIQIGSAL